MRPRKSIDAFPRYEAVERCFQLIGRRRLGVLRAQRIPTHAGPTGGVDAVRQAQLLGPPWVASKRKVKRQ